MMSALTLLFLTAVIFINTNDAAHIPRIIGGSSAPNHKYPYQVSFRVKISSEFDFHFCSGSILNSRWILTAGHCFADVNIKDIVAVVGTNYLDEEGDQYKIELAVVHESYTDFYYDDIALVRVADFIRFSENVAPVSLPEEDIYESGVPAVFSGWGTTELGGTSPNDLQEIQLNVVGYEKCKEKQSSVTPNHICSFTKYGEGICHGDSGGPLVADGDQIGIASYVVPCATGYPDVYTRVYKYVDWIRVTQERNQH